MKDMAATQQQGQLTTVDTVISGIMKDPVIAFLAALEDDLMPLRDIALRNGLRDANLVRSLASTSIKWTEGEKAATDIKLTTAIAADTTTEFNFDDDIGAVVPNMVISFNTENVLVVSVNETAKTCEVTRGYDGTTALSTIADNTIGKVLGILNGDLAVAGTGTAAFGAEYTNYAHMMESVLDITDAAANAPTDTGENSVAYQLLDKFAQMGRMLGNALWRADATGTTAAQRSMNGFRAQIASNSTAVSGALKFSHIDAHVETILGKGVVPDLLVVPPTIKTGLGQWAGGRLVSSTMPARYGTAGGQVTMYESAAGAMLEVLVDNSLLTTDVFICRGDNLGAGFLPILDSPYAIGVAGSPPPQYGVVAQVLGRKGFATQIQCGVVATSQLRYEEAAGLLTAVTSVDSDGV